MKTYKLKAVMILAIAAMTFSCNKDDDDNNTIPVYTSESPLENYLITTGFNQETDLITDGANREYGFKFRPTVTGAITAISVRIPDVNSELTATIWDVATMTAIKTETFNVTSSGVAVNKTITPLALMKDKEYAITINTGDYYRHYKTNNSSAAYPVSVGNIQITGAVYSDILQDFPGNSAPDYFDGDVNFTFLRTI